MFLHFTNNNKLGLWRRCDLPEVVQKAMEESDLGTSCPYLSSGQTLPFPPNHGISWLFICFPELGQSEL